MALVYTVDMWKLDVELIEESFRQPRRTSPESPTYLTFEELR